MRRRLACNIRERSSFATIVSECASNSSKHYEKEQRHCRTFIKWYMQPTPCSLEQARPPHLQSWGQLYQRNPAAKAANDRKARCKHSSNDQLTNLLKEKLRHRCLTFVRDIHDTTSCGIASKIEGLPAHRVQRTGTYAIIPQIRISEVRLSRSSNRQQHKQILA